MKKILVFLILMLVSIWVYAGTDVKSKDVTNDTTNFHKNLGSTDTTVQKALQTLNNATFASSGVNWGQINGTLSNQTDLQNALNAKTSSVNWGQINGTLTNQTDLNTALGTKITNPANMININWTDATFRSQSVNWSGGMQTAAIFNTQGSNAGLVQLWNAAHTYYINWTSNNLGASYKLAWPSNAPTAGLVPQVQDALGNINWVAMTGGTGGASNWSQLQGNPNQINWQQWPNTFSGQNGINWTSTAPVINRGFINWTDLINLTQGVNWGGPAQFAGNNITNFGSNVGIGSSAPGTELDVVGTIRATSLKATTGTRYLCSDTNGKVIASASACSGT